MDIEFVVSPGKIDPEKEQKGNFKDFLYIIIINNNTLLNNFAICTFLYFSKLESYFGRLFVGTNF